MADGATSNQINLDPSSGGTLSRRSWSPAEKKAIIEEAGQPGASLSSVARKYGIQPSKLFYWRKIIEDGELTGVGADEKVVPEPEVKALKDRIRSLERMLGRKTEEVEILKEAVRAPNVNPNCSAT